MRLLDEHDFDCLRVNRGVAGSCQEIRKSQNSLADIQVASVNELVVPSLHNISVGRQYGTTALTAVALLS